MRLQSARHVGLVWLMAAFVFLVTAWVSAALSPRLSPPVALPLSPGAPYFVGLIGLLAIGAAIALTWDWVRRAGPRAPWERFVLRLALVLLAVLWTGAMLFPFL